MSTQAPAHRHTGNTTKIQTPQQPYPPCPHTPFPALVLILVVNVKVGVLGDVDQLVAVKGRHSLGPVLVDGVGEVEHLVALGNKLLNKR